LIEVSHSDVKDAVFLVNYIRQQFMPENIIIVTSKIRPSDYLLLIKSGANYIFNKPTNSKAEKYLLDFIRSLIT